MDKIVCRNLRYYLCIHLFPLEKRQQIRGYITLYIQMWKVPRKYSFVYIDIYMEIYNKEFACNEMLST